MIFKFILPRLLITLTATMAQATTVKNCDDNRTQLLTIASSKVPAGVERIKNEVIRALNNGHDALIQERLNGALKKLNCMENKFQKLEFVCLNKISERYTAITVPIVGKKVTISDIYFEYDRVYQAAVLVHELSHKCGANDRTYFYQWQQSPNNYAENPWQNVASMYDWWYSNGFCIPGKDC